MNAAEREWVSLNEAAERVGVSMTTVRDWTRLGSVEMKELPSGRIVDLQQVREKAMGPAAARLQSGLQDRVSDGVAEQSVDHPPTEGASSEDGLTEILLGLQELARQRDPS
jgi:hypothetical protein